MIDDAAPAHTHVTLTCDIDGLTGQHPVSWYRNGTKISSSEKYTVETSSLTILDTGMFMVW